MAQIVDVHHPNVRATLIEEAISRFYFVRSLDGMRKPPSTSELIDWIGALVKGGIKEDELTNALPFMGALVKKEQDEAMLKRVLRRITNA